MKTPLLKIPTALVLCLHLLCYTLEPPPAQAQVAPAVFVVACVVIASCIIIKVMRTPTDVSEHVLVLEKSHYDGNWMPVVTNFHAILYAEKPITMFADQLRDDTALYRVIDITATYHPQFWPAEEEFRVLLPNGDTAVCDSNTAALFQP